jgi:hypothetical protein
MTEAQSVSESIRDLGRELGRLRKIINAHTGKQVQSSRLRDRFREFVQTYFRVVRPALIELGLDVATTDAKMEELAARANRMSAISQYKISLRELSGDLNKLEIRSETEMSDFVARTSQSAPSTIENRILSTIDSILPVTAQSYRQVLTDLTSEERFSYRGTATELREILRETLDYLAPDLDVMGSQGFQLDKNRTRPTMAQKARYILRLRGIPRNSIDVPRKAIEAVEETVSSLVRSTYDRGSIDTHTGQGISKPNVVQLKMYVDSVLCELLEIHSKS